MRQRRSGSVVGPIDDQRFADDILTRHKAPVTAVERRVAIIPHGEIAARRHHNLAALDVVLEHGLSPFVLGKIRLAGEIVAIGIDVFRLMDLVWLLQLVAVEEHVLVLETDMVARDSHHALHEGLLDVDGIAEYDDVPAFHVLVGENILADRPSRRVGQLVDQQVVADQQRIFHRSGGDDEGLNQSRGSEQQQQNGNGPFRDHAARDIGLGRLRGLLGFRG